MKYEDAQQQYDELWHPYITERLSSKKVARGPK